jgi:DNA-binding MurR/RpiR family transcriptional regulator
MDSIQKIHNNYQNLTHKQKQIADYLLANPENVCYMSLKELGEHTSASEVTILRMCTKLGFSNYIELKQSFRMHTKRLVKTLSESSIYPGDLQLSENGDQKQLLQKVSENDFEKSVDFYKNLNIDNVLKASKRILKAHNVLIFGQGISKIVADFFCRRLTPLGINVISIDPEDMDSVQARLAKLRHGDNIIIFSFPRYYMPVRNIAEYAHSKGASVTAITDSLESPAILENSLNFICQTSTKIFYNSLALPFALVNLIVTGIALEMGPQYGELINTTHEVINFINRQQDK